MKVYQIAEALGMDTDTVVARVRALGIPVNNKMSRIEADVAEQIKSSLLKDKQQDWVEIDMGNGIRKRVRKAPAPVAAPLVVAEPARPAERPRTGEWTAAPSAPSSVEPSSGTGQHAAAPSEVMPHVEARPPTAEHAAAPMEAPEPIAHAPAPHVAPAEPETVREAPTRVERPATGAHAAAPAAPISEPAPAHVEHAPVHAVEAIAPPPEAAAVAPPVERQPVAVVTPPSDRPVAVAVVPAPPPPPATAGTAGQSFRPASITPPPRTGTAVYDPITKTVTHIPSAPLRTRSVQVDASRISNTGGRGATRALPGQPARGPGGRLGPGRRPIGRAMGGPSRPAPTPTQMGAHKRVVKIEGQINLQELARRMSVKAPEVLMKLLQMGMTGVNINTTLDSDTAKLIAQEFQYEVEDVAVVEDVAIKALLPDFKDNEEDYISRPPVVTVMGHVDHGKTTLLDAILGMRVAEAEAGGITQKVSAYRVETAKGPVVFFDTPGHEAFTKLRARGAETTDVAVLVVAADDGVMPTTVEAINHAKVAGVPIVVALNKMDKPDAKPERVLQQLMGYDVIPEEFGGEVLVVKVSAKMRTGIEQLLESLALQSEVLDLKSNPKRPGRGTVFDATLDKGRGVVARILVQDGTMRTGDVVLTGNAVGKIRAMFDDRGKPITKAGPSTPIEILGLSELPNAGDAAYVVGDIKKAQAFADERKRDHSKGHATGGLQTLADIERRIAEGEMITVGVIIKAEAQASVEALVQALNELSTDKVKVQIVHTGIGGITESDVNLAIASKLPTTLIGFNVRPQGKAAALADSEKVSVRLYNIIYEALDDMKLLMEGQLKPTLLEKPLGKAEVRQVFNITKVGQVAGSYVTDGKFTRTAKARLIREGVRVWEGKLCSLKRFKDDVRDVAAGYECGIGLDGFNDIKVGDIIEAFEIEEIAGKL
ncbi:MAG: translation initiation factor IF-2 [Deltaproteobacteria bacterium]